MIDFTVLSAALNKVILPSIKNQLYARAPMWQILGGWDAEKSDPATGLRGVATRANVNVSRFENNKMYIPLMTGNMSGVVGIGLGEKYNYGDPNLAETYSQIKILVGSFTIPKAVLNQTDRGAIVKPLTFASDSLSRAMASDANRQTYGDASGIVATTAGIGTTTQTVALAPSVNGDIDYSRYLPKGTLIKIASNAITTVTGVTGDNTITIAAAQSWSAGANIVKVNSSNATSAELDGFKGMIKASGVYQNLDAATEGSWKSYVDSATETVTKATIQQKLHTAFFKANKTGMVKLLTMNATAFAVYGASLEDKVQRQQKEILSGGWIGLDYMGGNAQILLDYDNPDDSVLMLSPEDLVFGEFQPLEFEKGTDGTLLKITQQLDYEVTASWMGNMGTVARNSHAALRNKTFSYT